MRSTHSKCVIQKYNPHKGKYCVLSSRGQLVTPRDAVAQEGARGVEGLTCGLELEL